MVRRSAKSIKWYKKEAERLGYKDWRQLAKTWEATQKSIEAYSSWRRRYIEKLAKQTGLTKEQIKAVYGAPAKMGARLSDITDKKQIAKMKKAVEKTRTKWKPREVFEKVKSEVKRRTEEWPGGLTQAQNVLLSRLEAAVNMNEAEFQQMAWAISEMSDADIMQFYAVDDGVLFNILRISSPKSMKKMNAVPEEVSASDNADRLRHFLSEIAGITNGAEPPVVKKKKLKK